MAYVSVHWDPVTGIVLARTPVVTMPRRQSALGPLLQLAAGASAA